MSDPLAVSPAPSPQSGTTAGAVHEDRVLPAVVYGLYLIGVGHLTILLGLAMAYVCRAGAGPVASSHYTYQIRTFWLSIWWFIVGVLLCIGGGILSVVLIGIPFLFLGIAICGAVWLYFVIRSLIGIVYLAQGQAHPRPEAWLF